MTLKQLEKKKREKNQGSLFDDKENTLTYAVPFLIKMEAVTKSLQKDDIFALALVIFQELILIYEVDNTTGEVFAVEYGDKNSIKVAESLKEFYIKLKPLWVDYKEVYSYIRFMLFNINNG